MPSSTPPPKGTLPKRVTPREIVEHDMQTRTDAETIRRQTANRTLVNSIISGITLLAISGMMAYLSGINSKVTNLKESIGDAKGERGLMNQKIEQLTLAVGSVKSDVTENRRVKDESDREQRSSMNQFQRDLASLTAEVRSLVSWQTQQNQARK